MFYVAAFDAECAVAAGVGEGEDVVVYLDMSVHGTVFLVLKVLTWSRSSRGSLSIGGSACVSSAVLGAIASFCASSCSNS